MGSLIRLERAAGHLNDIIEIELPGSKSIHNRLLIISSLSSGKVKIIGKSNSDDTKYLESALNNTSLKMWMGEAGTALRFGLAWAAATPGERTIDGAARLRERPIIPLVHALREIGAEIYSLGDNEALPFKVIGKRLSGGSLVIEGNLSSQFISALLMIGPYTEKGIEIVLTANQVSMPYIQMTVDLMKQAGAKIEMAKNSVKVLPSTYGHSEISVEADWSSASYFYLWALFNPKLRIGFPRLSRKSVQGDRQISSLFSQLGVQTIEENGVLTIQKASSSIISEFDFTEMPDMAQTIAIAATGLKIPFKLKGLSTLRLKETDRIEALANELSKLGVVCATTHNSLELLEFTQPHPDPVIKTYSDHRMAMAFAPLASLRRSLMIENPEVVSKSFPHYWKEVKKIGVKSTKI